MAIASLIFGIIASASCFFGVYGSLFGVFFGVSGIIFGAVGRRRPQKRGIGTTGMILSIIGCAISLVLLFFLASLGACASVL